MIFRRCVTIESAQAVRADARDVGFCTQLAQCLEQTIAVIRRVAIGAEDQLLGTQRLAVAIEQCTQRRRLDGQAAARVVRLLSLDDQHRAAGVEIAHAQPQYLARAQAHDKLHQHGQRLLVARLRARDRQVVELLGFVLTQLRLAGTRSADGLDLGEGILRDVAALPCPLEQRLAAAQDLVM